MHEMALAASIVNLVEEAAHSQGARRVTEIRLEIGELANVEVEALSFSLEAALSGSLAEGAQVVYLRIPGRGTCLSCGETGPLTTLYDPCPRCAAHPVRPIQGRELRVKDIVVE